MPKKIKRNRVRCKKCNTILESIYTHDFVVCNCPKHKNIFTDGGREYIRRGGNPDQMEDLSEYEEEKEEKNEKPLASKEDINRYNEKALTFSKHPMFSSTRSTAHYAIMEFLANEEGKTIYKELAKETAGG